MDPLKTDGVTADNVTAPLVKILAPNSFTMHKEDFVASLNSEAELNFTPPGEKVSDKKTKSGRKHQSSQTSELLVFHMFQ